MNLNLKNYYALICECNPDKPTILCVVKSKEQADKEFPRFALESHKIIKIKKGEIEI